MRLRTIVLERRLICLFILAVLSSAVSFAHPDELPSMNQKQMEKFYNELSQKSSYDIMKLGLDLMDNHQAFDSAMVCANVVINRYDPKLGKEETELCIDAFNAAGYLCYYHFNDYSRAYDYLSRAIKIAEDCGLENSAICRTYLTVANMFVTSGINYASDNMKTTALSYYEKCFDTAYNIKLWDMYGKSFIYEASFLLLLKKNDEIKALLDKVAVSEYPTTERNYYHFLNMYKAMQAFVAGKNEEARSYLYAQTKREIGSTISNRYYCLTLTGIAHIFESEQQYDSAIVVFKKILPIARKHDMRDIVVASYNAIANDYLAKGDEGSFVEYNKMYAEAKDSLEHNSGLLDVGEKHFLTMLNRATETNEKLNSQVLNHTIVSFILAIIAIMAVMLFVLVNRKNKYLDERNRLLYERYQNVLHEGDNNPSETQKYKSSNLTEEEKQRLCSEIGRVLQMKDKICQSSFTIDEMAQLIGTNSRYVSQVINECYGGNFSSVVAERRVKEACRMFDDPELSKHLTIEAVSQSVGFKSRNSLISAFKKFTGLTPSEYQKASREEAE